MKDLRNHLSVFVVCMCFLIAVPIQASAEDKSSPTGKLRIQTERIIQGEKSETQSRKETELEERAPNLFEKETYTIIQSKQKELASEQEKLEQLLFVTPQVQDFTLKDTKESLFASDYIAPKTINSNSEIADGNDGMAHNTLLYILLGMVVLICGGVFVSMRKMEE